MARQVRVASNVLPQCPVVLVRVLRMVMVALPQVSLAVGASKAQAMAHSTILLPTQVMVGGVGSSTVTVCLQCAVLPEASVAGQVRVTSMVLPQRSLALCRVSMTLM